MVELKRFNFWLITGLLTGGVYLAVWVLNSMLAEIKDISTSVGQLNTNIAVIIDRQERDRKDIDNIDARLRAIENKKGD